eukprot:8923682-Alexandrium_andersonii.AAC.1
MPLFNVVGVDAGHLAVAAAAWLWAMLTRMLGWQRWASNRSAAGSCLARAGSAATRQVTERMKTNWFAGEANGRLRGGLEGDQDG